MLVMPEEKKQKINVGMQFCRFSSLEYVSTESLRQCDSPSNVTSTLLT